MQDKYRSLIDELLAKVANENTLRLIYHFVYRASVIEQEVQR